MLVSYENFTFSICARQSIEQLEVIGMFIYIFCLLIYFREAVLLTMLNYPRYYKQPGLRVHDLEATLRSC